MSERSLLAETSGRDAEWAVDGAPHDHAAADHWASAPRSQELGIADLYFGDAMNSDVKVEG